MLLHSITSAVSPSFRSTRYGLQCASGHPRKLGNDSNIVWDIFSLFMRVQHGTSHFPCTYMSHFFFHHHWCSSAHVFYLPRYMYVGYQHISSIIPATPEEGTL